MDVRLLHDIPGAGCKSIEHIAHAHAQSRPGFSFTAKDVLHARAGIRVEVDQQGQDRERLFKRRSSRVKRVSLKADCPDDDELPCASTEAPLLSCKPLTAASWANGLQEKSAGCHPGVPQRFFGKTVSGLPAERFNRTDRIA